MVLKIKFVVTIFQAGQIFTYMKDTIHNYRKQVHWYHIYIYIYVNSLRTYQSLRDDS